MQYLAVFSFGWDVFTQDYSTDSLQPANIIRAALLTNLAALKQSKPYEKILTYITKASENHNWIKPLLITTTGNFSPHWLNTAKTEIENGHRDETIVAVGINLTVNFFLCFVVIIRKTLMRMKYQ